MTNKIIAFVLAVLFIFVTALTYGQKCKYNYKRKDRLTGEISKGTTNFTVEYWWGLGLHKKGTQYFVATLFYLEGNLLDVITPEDKIIFKLENGEIITTYANEVYGSRGTTTNQYGVITLFTVRYNITEFDLHKIATTPLTDIIMTFGNRTFEKNIPAKKGKSFQKKAICILQ